MSLDFNKLISAPQTSVQVPQNNVVKDQPLASAPTVAQPVANAPVMQKPLQKDTYTTQEGTQSKPVTFIDQALKYSGIVALVATPVAIIASNRMNAATTKKMFEELGSKFNTKIEDLATKIQDSKVIQEGMKATQDTIKTQVDDIATKSTTILKDLALVGTTVYSFANVKGAAKKKLENKEISEPTKELLQTEATKRVNGEYSWPNIENVQAWMVTAETQSFLKIGGLAEVGIQLPDAFNNKFKNDPKNHMDIITPLYVGNDGDKKKASVEAVDEKHFVYTGAEGKKIDLVKEGSMSIKVYNDKTGSYKNENVDILTGTLNGSKYIFLRNDKIFSMNPHKDNKSECKGAYVLNDNKVSEAERMTFFSKAVYQLMRDAKEAKVQNVEAPNVMIANDWHASAISSMMRYDAPVVHEQKKMSDETFEYIKNTPVIHITHNAQYQGSDWQNADKIFRTLFEDNTDDINAVIKGYDEEGFPLSEGMGNYNEALSDLYLADRSVAVSRNYANELCKANDLGCGLEAINNIRKDKGTMLGIVNGYTKSLSEPNQAMIDTINSKLSPAKPFVKYEGMYNDEGYAIKLQNKENMINLLNDMANKAKEGQTLPGFTLYKPENCVIPKNIDVTKVPIIANVGRYVEQKGYDYLVDSLEKVLKGLDPDQEPPIVTILGSGDAEVSKQLQKLKDDITKVNKKAGERIFIFEGFSAGLRDGLGVASDFFLIPSKWEPCGLTQMECMPKGSLPVALATGGLADTIVDGKDGFLSDVFYGHKTNEKIFGFTPDKLVFPKDNTDAFAVAVNRALNTYYSNPDKIKQMAIKAMEKDFSWDVEGGSLDQYIELMKTGKVNQK